MTDNAPTQNTSKPEGKLKCGIIMPISELDGLTETHWVDVLGILSAAIEDAGFEANLVSTTDEVGIIQKTIIQNLYDNPIVVCDVSGKNPNVMFELGMRLAFDRPTVIVKDDKTAYTFDTSPIQHLSYPRDLRFNQIIDFKANLSSKLKSTHKKASSDPSYTTFLKHFGEFKVAKIDKTEVSGQQFIIEELQSLRETVANLERSTRQRRSGASQGDTYQFILKHSEWVNSPDLVKYVEKNLPGSEVEIKPDRIIVTWTSSSALHANEMKRLLAQSKSLESAATPQDASSN